MIYKRKKITIEYKIINCLISAGKEGIPLGKISKIVYGYDSRKYQLRIIKYVGVIRIRKKMQINYNKTNRSYYLNEN